MRSTSIPAACFLLLVGFWSLAAGSLDQVLSLPCVRSSGPPFVEAFVVSASPMGTPVAAGTVVATSAPAAAVPIAQVTQVGGGGLGTVPMAQAKELARPQGP
jgi:hypothetical protein